MPKNSCEVGGKAEPVKEVAPILVFGLRESGQDENYQPKYEVVFRMAETYWEPWIPGTFSKDTAEATLKGLLSKKAWERDYLGVIS